ncbi:IclR family transcriptional regulator [Cupriavidus basilensis]|uniref:IclR family transcriptional regulator n=1 Tax=Cupriavidus basilensis TaxID=68895 RepID=A0ABT6ANP3_9BURK|nr:IclR family transcriptional regulator [Cupriavidus basilensis]MDF3833922.1 IclR family transcriptional regulator [Cupriavidus basilensis]
MKTSPDPTRADLPAGPPAHERRQRVQSAQTGMAVLKGLARLGGRAALTALAAHVGESPAKVHRYLASLVDEGLVAQEASSQQYFLGPEAMLIGLAAMRQVDPIRVAEPSLIRLRESLGVTCFVAVMGNKGPTIVRFEEPGLPVTVNVRVGSVMPLLWSATGRMFLGMLDEPAVRAMAEAELAAAPAELRAELDAADPIGVLRREVQAAGCSAVRDTNLKGISAVAAPLYDYTGRIGGVITALGATGGFDAAVDGPIAIAVRREAQAASALLGYAAAAGQGGMQKP